MPHLLFVAAKVIVLDGAGPAVSINHCGFSRDQHRAGCIWKRCHFLFCRILQSGPLRFWICCFPKTRGVHAAESWEGGKSHFQALGRCWRHWTNGCCGDDTPVLDKFKYDWHGNHWISVDSSCFVSCPSTFPAPFHPTTFAALVQNGTVQHLEPAQQYNFPPLALSLTSSPAPPTTTIWTPAHALRFVFRLRPVGAAFCLKKLQLLLKLKCKI